MEFLLNQGELLDLGKNLRGLKVICHSGDCWLTQAGDSRDYLLGDGHEVAVRSKGQVIICAFTPCRLQLKAELKPIRRPLIPATVNLQ